MIERIIHDSSQYYKNTHSFKIENKMPRILVDKGTSYNLSHCAPQDFIDRYKQFFSTNYMAIGWLTVNHLLEHSGIKKLPGTEFTALESLLQSCNIRSILDIGCGGSEFLNGLLPLSKKLGIQLYGIDLNIKPYELNQNADFNKKVRLVEGDARKLKEYLPDISFDLIVCSGVLGRTQHSLARLYPSGYLSILKDAIINDGAIIESSVKSLSDNPAAAMFAQNFSSFFLLDRNAIIEKGIKVSYWNNEQMRTRKEVIDFYDSVLGSCSSDEDISLLRKIWNTGANIAAFEK